VKTGSAELQRPLRTRTARRTRSRPVDAGGLRKVCSPRPRAVRGPVTFQSAYGETYLALIDVQPHWVYAHWEVTEAELERARREIAGPGEFVIRVYTVTYIHFSGTNAHSYFDIAVDTDVGHWYVNLLSTGESLIADIGLRGSDGKLVAVARSNCVEMPRAGQPTDGEKQWMFVDGDPRKRHRVPCGVSVPRRGANGRAPARLDLCEAPHKIAITSITRRDVMEFYRELFECVTPLREATNAPPAGPDGEPPAASDTVLDDRFAGASEGKRCPAA